MKTKRPTLKDIEKHGNQWKPLKSKKKLTVKKKVYFVTEQIQEKNLRKFKIVPEIANGLNEGFCYIDTQLINAIPLQFLLSGAEEQFIEHEITNTIYGLWP